MWTKRVKKSFLIRSSKFQWVYCPDTIKSPFGNFDIFKCANSNQGNLEYWPTGSLATTSGKNEIFSLILILTGRKTALWSVYCSAIIIGARLGCRAQILIFFKSSAKPHIGQFVDRRKKHSADVLRSKLIFLFMLAYVLIFKDSSKKFSSRRLWDRVHKCNSTLQLFKRSHPLWNITNPDYLSLANLTVYGTTVHGWIIAPGLRSKNESQYTQTKLNAQRGGGEVLCSKLQGLEEWTYTGAWKWSGTSAWNLREGGGRGLYITFTNLWTILEIICKHFPNLSFKTVKFWVQKVNNQFLRFYWWEFSQ